MNHRRRSHLRWIPWNKKGVKRQDLALIVRLAGHLTPYGWAAFVSLLVLGIDALLDATLPYLMKIAIDVHIMRGDLPGLIEVTSLYLGVSLLGGVTQFLRMYLLQWTGQKAISGLREKIMAGLLSLPASYYDRTPVGSAVTRAVNDMEAIQELFTQGVIVVVGDILAMVIITGALFWMDWRLALVSMAVVPVVILATRVYRKKARGAYGNIREAISRLNSFLQETIGGMLTVQVMGFSKYRKEKFEALNGSLMEHNLKAIHYSSIFFPFVEVVGATALASIIWFGGGKAVQGELDLGVLVAFIQYMKRFFQPIRDIAEKYNLFQAALISSERVFEVLDLTTEESDPVSHSRLPANLNGEVHVRDLWFQYEPSEWVLRGVTFHVAPGETLAIVGFTGAGKSSLIGLFNRLYEPQRGNIFIDGLDIRSWPLGSLRKQIGIIPQDVFLFRGSILDNVRLWNPLITLDDVREAAKDIGVDQWILSLPEGYETALEDRGRNLSLGQRQLLAFLRALVYNPKVLVLDEATSSIDPEAESLMQGALVRMLGRRTTIVIAHRLSTVQKAHRILVLHQGRILEEGSHQELLALRGLYWRLYQLQEGSFAPRRVLGCGQGIPSP